MTVRGRFAPSPTGPLHLGSLVAAVGSWLSARSAGGEWLVRMEDLDGPRVVPGAADEILRALERYGLTWDGEVVVQSERTGLYEEALARLRAAGLAYDCGCTRAEVARAAGAPDVSDPVDGAGAVYAGTCRGGLAPGRAARAVRFRVPDGTVAFEDRVRGRIEEEVSRAVGDFVVKRADGPFAYQLAVVVDDAAQGVTEVVRGADLLRLDRAADRAPAGPRPADAGVRAPSARPRSRREEAREARRRAAARDARRGARPRDARARAPAPRAGGRATGRRRRCSARPRGPSHAGRSPAGPLRLLTDGARTPRAAASFFSNGARSLRSTSARHEASSLSRRSKRAGVAGLRAWIGSVRSGAWWRIGAASSQRRRKLVEARPSRLFTFTPSRASTEPARSERRCARPSVCAIQASWSPIGIVASSSPWPAKRRAAARVAAGTPASQTMRFCPSSERTPGPNIGWTEATESPSRAAFA